MRCDQCGKSNGTLQEAWICDPGGQPLQAWLHRECESAFLQRLEPNRDLRLRRNGPRGGVGTDPAIMPGKIRPVRSVA